MVERYSFGPRQAWGGQNMKCPQCRQKTRHADIAYVSTKKKDGEADALDDVKVRPSPSSVCLVLSVYYHGVYTFRVTTRRKLKAS